ncbi:MAG TPA: hypothetical protein PLX08_14135 [Bacteroidales bacterium]|nr:hypothetical protein [Bacteroidales bacterium]
MKRLFLQFALLSLFSSVLLSQANSGAQAYLSSEDNLKAISNLSPYSTGGLGFDNRYEGVKGTSMLMDTLLPSLMKLRGQSYYIQLNADLDVFHNYLVYRHPKTKQLYSVPVDLIAEVFIDKDGKNQRFLNTTGEKFEKDLKEQRFYQILYDRKYRFIKIPGKQFVRADYKNAYSADRRYDEYIPANKYYLKGPDSLFHQVQLNRKSILKVYPGLKSVSGKLPPESSFADKEEMVVEMLKEF